MADYVGIQSIKQAYSQQLIEVGDSERGIAVYNKEIDEPIYEGTAFHPESEPVKDAIDTAFEEIVTDFTGLSKELIQISDDYTTLINNMKIRLAAIDQRLEAEEDRIRDLNAICGKYTSFDIVTSVTDTTVTGTFSYSNKTFTGTKTDSSDSVTLTVSDIRGNGYEGNAYIQYPLVDTSDRNALVDLDELTDWEYSRYTGTNSDNVSFLINQDNEPARCVITLEGDNNFIGISLKSVEDIVIESVSTSEDGGISYETQLEKEIHINQKDRKYTDANYAYESGVLAFPQTDNVKIQIRSNGVTEDKVVDNDGNVLSDVYRHLISIDEITADNSTYSDAYFTTNELIGQPVSSIAVFANEYIPSHFSDDTYITYTLTVNGIDYDVVPMNSNQSGTKIIRYSDYTTGDDSIKHIDETIKNATLTVYISMPDCGGTPYLSNLKVCLGKVAATE